MRKKYYAQPHQKARTAKDHLNVKLNIFCLSPIKLGHPHPTCQKNKNPSWFHRIIRKTISGASPPNLSKKTKNKVNSTESSEKLFLAHPHPTCQKNKKQKLIPQNHQKDYFWGIPTQPAKKTKNKVGSTESSEKLFIWYITTSDRFPS